MPFFVFEFENEINKTIRFWYIDTLKCRIISHLIFHLIFIF